MASCIRCQLEGLVWDHDYKEKTGKWRLYDKNQERPHNCKVVEDSDYWCCGTCGIRTDDLICAKGHRGSYMRLSEWEKI